MTRDGKDPWIYSRKNNREDYSCLPEYNYACTYKSSQDYKNTVLIYTDLRLLYISDFLLSASQNNKKL